MHDDLIEAVRVVDDVLLRLAESAACDRSMPR
jgi:hypothetical protein